MDLEKRIRMAAESILENEALRQDMEGEALLNWGLACAEKIAAETAPIEDDEAAQESSYPRMKALRRMLNAVKNLYAPETDSIRRGQLLAEIAGFVPLVYGENAKAPEPLRWNVFVAMQMGTIDAKVSGLRALIEPTAPETQEKE